MKDRINYDNIIKQIITDKDNHYRDTFFNQFKSGTNNIYNNRRTEIIKFEEEWIDTLESYFPSLNKIILAPKNDLRYESDVVLVEKARKINSDSVKHLASNTHLIKNIDKDGMIIPNKILTTFSEIEYATYENRFIKTLIERLFHFVRRRYQTIKKNVESFQRTNLILNSSFPFNNEEVTLDINITVKEDLENKKINEDNLKLLKRVEQLNKLITGFYQSEFMKLLEKAHPIQLPIMKTQVILKNVDYNNAYLLWLFLDKYNKLPYDLLVTDEKIKLDDNELANMEEMVYLNYLSLVYTQNRKALEVAESNNYTKTGFNKLATHPNDLLDNPEYLTMESNISNEYYLNEFKKLFEDNYDNHLTDVKLEETALRRSMRDLNDITNSIYDSYFEIETEGDYFNRLRNIDNPLDEFDQLKNRSKYSKIIREVKEVDLNNHIRLERRIIKRILELNNRLVKESKKTRIITIKNIEDIILNDFTKKKIKEYDKFLKTLLEEIKAEKLKVEIETKEANEEIEELVKKLKEEEDILFKETRDKLEAKMALEFKKITKEHELQLKRIRDRFIKEERERDLKLETRIININKEHNKNISQIEVDLEKYFKGKLKEYEESMNNELLKAKISSEEIQMKNEFERNNIIQSELYKNRNK